MERSDTHHVIQQGDGYRKGSTHPTGYGLLLAHVIVHNAHDPATTAAALALDQDDADAS